MARVPRNRYGTDPSGRERSKCHGEGEPQRQRLNGFEMDVVDGRGLVRQLRGVEIVDLVGAGIIEQIENVEPEPRLLGKFVPEA